MSFHSLLRKAKHGLGDLLPGEEKHSHTHHGHACHDDHGDEHSINRYCSFAPQSSGHPKWYVDGASYFWAVSMALEGEFRAVFLAAIPHTTHHTAANRIQRPESTSTLWTGG
jgi:phospholipase D1/2